MSTKIVELKSKDLGPGVESMLVSRYSRGIQFTLGVQYCALSPEEARKLIEKIDTALAIFNDEEGA